MSKRTRAADAAPGEAGLSLTPGPWRRRCGGRITGGHDPDVLADTRMSSASQTGRRCSLEDPRLSS